jgi:hypothetical protein
MTRRMLLTAALAVLAGGGSPDVAGEWLVVATFDSVADRSVARRIELVCSFEQHGAAITGSCRPADGPESVQVSGTAHDETIEWSFQIAPSAKEQKQTATFKGTARSAASIIRGTFTLGELRGDFEATRQ